MKKVLLIGNGAREHVMAEALTNSKHDVELYVIGKAKIQVLMPSLMIILLETI